MQRIPRIFGVVAMFVVFSMVANANESSDVEDLTAMLHEFLAGSSTEAAHEKFWADELIYTSSRGTRTTKADIMASFGDAIEDEGSDEPAIVYTAEDIQIEIYGSTAVVAFMLVGTPDDGSLVLTYFNTGTFLKRDNKWQVVAWQATVIPAQ